MQPCALIGTVAEGWNLSSYGITDLREAGPALSTQCWKRCINEMLSDLLYVEQAANTLLWSLRESFWILPQLSNFRVCQNKPTTARVSSALFPYRTLRKDRVTFSACCFITRTHLPGLLIAENNLVTSSKENRSWLCCYYLLVSHQTAHSLKHPNSIDNLSVNNEQVCLRWTNSIAKNNCLSKDLSPFL